MSSKYCILNLDETGRFWNDDYEIPVGWDRTEYYDSIEEAEEVADKLLEQNKHNSSTHTTVLGIYVHLDHYPCVVYKTIHSIR